MKSLISRESYRPEKRYSGVYHVQGSMVTDADLDERSRITQDRTDNLGNDTIKDGVPNTGGAVAIGAGGALSLQEGVIYADGVRGILTATPGANLNTPLALFSHQADFPQSPALPNNAEQIIYADIWERPVYPLEDSYLADAGLHGAITAFRTRTMTQVKAAPLTALPDIENGTGTFPQIGTGKLAVTPLNAVILADECDPCADVVSAEQKIANALWRLEVIDVTGTPEAPGKVTLAWSIENAAAIGTADVSHEHFERTGKVYEFFSEITESHLGVFAKATNAKRSAFVDDMSVPPTPATDHNGQPWPFVRRWDGQAVLNTSTAQVTSKKGSGFEISISGKIVTLRVDAFEVTVDLSGAAVMAGDYWLVELRRFAPQPERIRLVKETPFGVIHHYCTLFRVDASGVILQPTDSEIRKLSSPVLSNLPATHVGFENNCEKLYADAENVQEALDNLCQISADDIGFQSNCPELYNDSQNVQDALDALCKIDFSVHSSFRLLFDWGVLCGIVPEMETRGSGKVKISSGSFLDRSGRITHFKGGRFDLNTLVVLRNQPVLNTEKLMNVALRKGEVCLALSAEDGGNVSVHVVPTNLAYGPEDPGFRERLEECVKKKKQPHLRDKVEKLPRAERVVAEKILITSASEGAFGGTAKLTEAEAGLASSFNERLLKDFRSAATEEETAIFIERIQKARNDNPISGTQGAARQVRQMQQATAIFKAFLTSDEERLRRCVCEALFPTCPPALGKAPFFVPIACLRGTYTANQFFLNEICAFCCRKQAMTWRSLQYFIGDSREKVSKLLGQSCCRPKEDEPGGDKKPGRQYDPERYLNVGIVDLMKEYQVTEAFTGPSPTSPTDYKKKILVNDLSEADAKKTLIGNGIEIAETFDLNDEQAFKIISEKSIGVSSTDRLISAGEVRPGDKVGLIVEKGKARGYVLLERGSGKLPFSTRAAAITREDQLKAEALITSTNTAKADLNDLINSKNTTKNDLTELLTLREKLSADVIKLKTDVEALETERKKSVNAVNEVATQLTQLAKTRTEITKEVATVKKELVSAEKNRKTIITSVRESQPVTVVTGNNPALISQLASMGVTTVADVSKLTTANINALIRARVLANAAAGTTLKTKAQTFLKRPLG